MKRKEPIELPEGWKFVAPCKWVWKGPYKLLPKHKPKDWEAEIEDRKGKLLFELIGKKYLDRSKLIKNEGQWAKMYCNSPVISKPHLFGNYDRYLAVLHKKEKRSYLDLFLRSHTKSLYYPDSKEVELHVSTKHKEEPLRFEPKELFDQQSQLAQREMDKAAAMGSDLNSVLAYWKEEWNNWKIRDWVYGKLLDTLNKHLEALEGQFEAISSKQKGPSAQSETQAEKQTEKEPEPPPNDELWEKFFEWLRGGRSKENLCILFCGITGYDFKNELKLNGYDLMTEKTGLKKLDGIKSNAGIVFDLVKDNAALDRIGVYLINYEGGDKGVTERTVIRLLRKLETSPLKKNEGYLTKINNLLSS